tara:strand:+ start:1283 stop:1399 length:117 start_codon:yes stop_codon:yes gene_type:complete
VQPSLGSEKPRLDSTPVYLWGEGHMPNEAIEISEQVCG